LRVAGVGGVLRSVNGGESNDGLLCTLLCVEGVGGVLKSAMASTPAGICGMLGEDVLLCLTVSRTCQAGDKGLSYNTVLAVLEKEEVVARTGSGDVGNN
jgi:hypothetical protein